MDKKHTQRQIQNQIVIIEKVGIHFSLPIFHPQIDAQLIHYTARWMKTTIKTTIHVYQKLILRYKLFFIRLVRRRTMDGGANAVWLPTNSFD